MNIIHSFFVTMLALVLCGFGVSAQEKEKSKVDPGVSVHNYKHPHKAKKAEKLQKLQRRGQFASGVGIGRRPIMAPDARYQPNTPKYRKRSLWVFPVKSRPSPTRLNPLTNPGNYKTHQ